MTMTSKGTKKKKKIGWQWEHVDRICKAWHGCYQLRFISVLKYKKTIYINDKNIFKVDKNK